MNDRSKDVAQSVKHPEWTDETIARFWDYWATRPARDATYFSNQVGDGLKNLARWYGLLHGNVLDYGCAKGHLTTKLLDEDVTVSAVDFSSTSIAQLNDQHAGRPNWHGGTSLASLPSPLPEASFDLIYCVEVVEHLLPEWQQPTLKELARLLSPDGYVIVTTPLAEDLAASHIYCPFCESVFHQMQHVRSITAEQLRCSLTEVGLTVEFCQGVELANFQRLWAARPTRIWQWPIMQQLVRYDGPGSTHRSKTSPVGPNWRFRRAARLPGTHLVAIASRATT